MQECNEIIEALKKDIKIDFDKIVKEINKFRKKADRLPVKTALY